MTPEALRELLEPYTRGVAGDWPRLYAQLTTYLELILKWNARTNLTAIRAREEIVRRHFGESLFAGARLGECGSLLDFGSGAGFPGLPIQLLRPDIAMTLAESQGKKAAFLREAVRALGLETEVWAGRVESMPAERRFDTVTLRAVDRMEEAVAAAGARADRRVLMLTTVGKDFSAPLPGFYFDEPVRIPGSDEGVVLAARRG